MLYKQKVQVYNWAIALKKNRVINKVKFTSKHRIDLNDDLNVYKTNYSIH